MIKYILFTFLLFFVGSTVFAQSVQGTIKKTDTDKVTVYANPSANIVDQLLDNVNITVSVPDQGGATPTAIISINNSQNLNWSVAGGNPDFSGGRAYYTYVGNDNSSNTLTNWTTGVDNPVFEITFSSPVVASDVQLDDLSPFGGPSAQSFWYVQFQVLGDLTNYPAMFYGAGAVNNGGASPSFMVASDATLPVELMKFEARLKEEQMVALNWVTATEINNAYFVLERSKDAIRFENIAEIAGAGNATVATYYDFLDKKPFSGTSYYRLKQIDFDGTSSYSDIRSVKTGTLSRPKLSINPNPVQENLNLTFADFPEEEVQITIYDISGRLIYNQQVIIENGKSTINLSTIGVYIPEGIYLLNANVKGKNFDNHKFVKVE